ncbi:MAG TPA: hypothetical protein VF211_10460 [Burkholderiales bacterium]
MSGPESAVLWLLVVFGGIAAGAGFYEMRVALPLWFPRSGGAVRVDAETMRRMDSGRRFWAYVTTVPLTLLTLASLALAWGLDTPRGGWWLAAACVGLVERAATFGYFIPNAVRLMRAESLPAAQAAASAGRWIALNRLRMLLALIAWLAALRALSLPG